MRKTGFLLLAVVLVLSAVEWEIEQITDDPQHCTSNPVMLMDAQGHSHALFTRWDKNTGDATLDIASNQTGSWTFTTVDSVNLEYFGPYYSFGLDSEGNYFVAFTQFVEEYFFDLYFATDTSGGFVTQRLEDNGNLKTNPIVQLDSGGGIHLSYWEYDEALEEVQIRYGWFDEGGFNSQLATKNVHQDDPVGTDFLILDDTLLYIFYCDDNEFRLNYATRAVSDSEWRDVRINSYECFFLSAVADVSGVFHIAYRDGWEGIRYITNPTGGWMDEFAVSASEIWWWQDGVCIATDDENTPYMIYSICDYENEDYDLFFAKRKGNIWVEEPFAAHPNQDEYGGCGHHFLVDSEGYGHVVYEVFDETGEDSELYYAKSRDPLSVGVAEQPLRDEPIALEIRNSIIYLNLTKSSYLYFSLYDAAGRRVQCLASGSYPAGEHTIPIISTGLAAGVYFLRLESGNSAVSAKMVKTK